MKKIMGGLLLTAALLLVFLFMACAPAAKNIRSADGQLYWETTREARCYVGYCENGQCRISLQEKEYRLVHSFDLPQGASEARIFCEGRDGLRSITEVP